MNGLPELVEVLTGYWDRQRIVFRFGTVEITPTLKEIRDYIDIVGTRIKKREKTRRHLFP